MSGGEGAPAGQPGTHTGRIRGERLPSQARDPPSALLHSQRRLIDSVDVASPGCFQEAAGAVTREESEAVPPH